MDFFSKTSMDVATLALDGLAARHNALLSNISNAETPGYKRVDVKFEDQLKNIINNDNLSEENKMANSVGNGPGTPGLVFVANSLIPQGVSFNNDNKFQSNTFQPEVIADDNAPVDAKGNSVNIESEMVELAKNGTKYEALTTLQQKEFAMLSETIKGAT